ncbi:NfeD family protein [Betaproteobacteria bacterium SCN1]|jgi:membrane protein implicated in regulation of membrane protease activity|nr:NfeD family protein [Betaproteobacteria bacterium SCN1]
MQTYLLWWIVAAVLVGLELTTGTFYLLLYGLAAAAAGIAAWMGLGWAAQFFVAALIAILGTLALQRWKRDTAHPESTVQDMDIGQTVQVESWQDGRGQVRYRGALWDAEAVSADTDAAQPLIIRAVRGNTLILGN